MTDWNGHFKRIRLALSLDLAEVVDICRAGGIEIAVSRVEGWKRNPRDNRRYVVMSEAEFDAFTAGLPEWARENIDAGG